MNTLDSFIETTTGTMIDMDCSFVTQSPDFGIAYLRHMTATPRCSSGATRSTGLTLSMRTRFTGEPVTVYRTSA